MTDYFCILTPEGRTKLAQAALLEQPLAITHMAVGDGNPLTTPPADEQTALVHQVYRAPLNKLYAPDADRSVVIAEMAIPTTAGGWHVNEISLEDDTGVVIAVGNYPLTWKPSYTSGTGRVLLIRIMLDVNNAENVALLIDPAAVMASEQHVRLAIEELRQHVDAPTGVAPGTYTKVEVNARGLVVQGWNPTTLADYGITNAYTKAQSDLLLSGKANNAITLAGYGIGDAYTKANTDQLLSGKANNAITLAGYGIGDAYTKANTDQLLSGKANNAITLAGYGIGDAYTKTQVDNSLATKQPNLGFTPVQQGGGQYQDNNKIYLGWSVDHLRAQVNASDLGRIWTEQNRPKNTAAFGNPAWWRCSDTGTVRQRGVAPIMTNVMEQRVTFPSAFAETPVVALGIWGTTNDAEPGVGQKNELYASIIAIDNTGFTLASRRLAGADVDYVTVMWQAEGRT